MGLNDSEWVDRRQSHHWTSETADTGFWMPSRGEIVTQFFTRYLFFALAVLYFATMETTPSFLSIEQLLIALVAYFILNTWFFHRALRGVTLAKIRGAMFADLAVVVLCVVHDPNPIPPSALAFLMVLLGNGMRYGMHLFTEVLGGATFGMAFAFALRYRLGGFEVSAGDVFFGVFWVTLAVYAYLLMGRIEEQRRQLDYRSRYGALTGLLNRHGLLAVADRMLGKQEKPVATVLFADLNEFKAVNDRHGHGVGDRVLAEFARIFRESMENGVCGRWGGDEFVAILPPCDGAALHHIIDRIDARSRQWSQGNGLPMAVSLGVAQAPRDGGDLVTLLSVADIDLHQSKSRQPAAAGASPQDRNTINEPEAT